MTFDPTYRLSFTAANLRHLESIYLAEKAEAADWQLRALSYDVMRGHKSGTNKRVFNELKLRLEQLSSAERELLLKLPSVEQRVLLLAASSRLYPILRELLSELIAEKWMTFDLLLSPRDLRGFIERKRIQYDRLENLEKVTLEKIRTVLARMLQQGGLVDKVPVGQLTKPILSNELRIALRNFSCLNFLSYE